MKKQTQKVILGLIIIAVLIGGTILLFKYLPPIPKLFLLGVDVVVYYLVVTLLFKSKKTE